jgi:hypothetical protein
MILTQNWSNLDTLDYFNTSTKPYLLFSIIITTWKFKIKKPSVEVKISNLNNYLADCCWNGKGTLGMTNKVQMNKYPITKQVFNVHEKKRKH